MNVFQVFFEQSQDLCCTASDTLYFEELNPAWESTLGWAREELRAVPLTEFVHPEDVQKTLATASQLQNSGTSTVNFVIRFRHQQGHWIPLSWTASFEGSTFYASARDVSELQETQRRSTEALSRLQSILESANYSIIETTRDGIIRLFNRAAERMLGYSADEVIDKVTPGIIHDREEVVRHSLALSQELGETIEPGFETFVAKARRGVAEEREWTYVRKDGSRFPVRLSVTARRDSQGEIVGFLGIAKDISASKHTEDRLNESERLLSTVFSSMAVGMVIQDQTGAICDVNPAAESILGLPREQLLGMESIDSRWRSTHPDGSPFPRSQHPSMVALRTGEPQNDVQMWIRSGEDRLAMISINARLIPAPRDSQSQMVVSTFRDISRQILAEQELRDSETRSRAIIDTAVDAFITIDELGRIERVNPAVQKLFGYVPEELVGDNVRKLMPSPAREEHDSYLRNFRETGVRKIIGIGREVVALRKDGTCFPAELAVSEMFLGGQRYFSGVIRDISDRKRVERLQGEFISTVSHELRTPLTSIRGSLGLLSGGMLGELPEEAREYVEIALNNSDRLVRLINDILDIEKIQSGSMELRSCTTELAQAVRSAAQANAGFASSHQVALKVRESIPAGEVLVDQDRLAQVFANLISNAVKFSPPHGLVELSVGRKGRWFRVGVSDQGPGIPKEFEGRIFSRFAQADASSTRQKGGTGLGLSITKALVEKMGGRIGFYPGESGGTVFFFDLPYLHPVAELSPGREAPCVLVCEDDPDIARLLDEMLTSAGYVVHFAPTMERARRLLREHRYDAVTLDLILADGESAGLIPEIRSRPATQNMPIIVISGSQSQLGQAAVLVSDVIRKPFSEDRLLAAVHAALSRKQPSIPSVLHVEDDPDICRIVRKTLPPGWDIMTAHSLRDAREVLAQRTFDIILLDLSLPDGGGDDLLTSVGQAQVIIFSAQDTSAELSQRVSAALVKAHSTPTDVRESILSLLGSAKSDSVKGT
ncbi:PAS domain S-box protein [bacterium]|nr:PAS domain S-box protein [bacterium]